MQWSMMFQSLGAPRPGGPCARPGLAASIHPPTARRRVGVQAAGRKATFGSFDAMIQQSDAVLVDFYATWCGPCQIMSKAMAEVSGEWKHKVMFAKVDTERYPSIASRYQVSALPTLVLFKNGKPVRRFEGALSSPDLNRWLQQATK